MPRAMRPGKLEFIHGRGVERVGFCANCPSRKNGPCMLEGFDCCQLRALAEFMAFHGRCVLWSASVWPQFRGRRRQRRSAATIGRRRTDGAGWAFWVWPAQTPWRVKHRLRLLAFAKNFQRIVGVWNMLLKVCRGVRLSIEVESHGLR